MADEPKFIDGLRVFKPNEKAPDWVIANGSIDKQELLNWLSQQEDDTIRFDIKLSKSDKFYAQINTWKPSDKARQQVAQTSEPVMQVDGYGDVPF